MSRLNIAVVVPLEDPRGDVVDHLRSWTHRQTLDRDRYQLIACTDGADPAFATRVAEILAPQDEIVTVPGASLMELYQAGARASRAEAIVFTEAHCHAEPGCLAAVVEIFAAHPELDGVSFHQRQGTFGAVGRLSERWFDRSHARWRQYDWTRLRIGGAAIRAEAYERAGGIDPELDLFAPFCLSARLADQGGRVEHLEVAVVTHVLEEEMGEDLQHSARYARGECAARAKHDPEFMDRYFGAGGLWDRRLAYRPEVSRALVAALISAARRSPRDRGWIAIELAARLPARITGPRARLACERALAGLHRKVTDSGLFSFERRWRSYVLATKHTLKAVQLREGSRDGGTEGRLAAAAQLPAERLDGILAGGYGLERDRERRFRWTEPAALLRLAPSGGGDVLRIETGGLRGEPLAYVQGLYAADQSLPSKLISGDGEALEVRLPPHFAAAVRSAGLVVICRPFVPAREGSSDHRRLGMPVVGLELSKGLTTDGARSAAVPQASQ